MSRPETAPGKAGSVMMLNPVGKVFRLALPGKHVFAGQNNVLAANWKPDDQVEDGGNLTKNAILARENRRKKKAYIKDLQDSLDRSEKDNAELRTELQRVRREVDRLATEATYLRNVLANVEDIAGLVRTVRAGSSMPLSSSLLPPPTKKIKTEVSWLQESPPSDSTFYQDDFVSPLMLVDEPLATPIQDPVLSPTFTSGGSGSAAAAGVCLHVRDKRISLEFCASCSANALQNWCDQD